VRHRQAADVQRSQTEAVHERGESLLGRHVVAGEEHDGAAVLEHGAEERVEGLDDVRAGRGDLGGLGRDGGRLVVGEPVGRRLERVADVDDDLAREGVAVLGDDGDDGDDAFAV
jgi:hypothetical protein